MSARPLLPIDIIPSDFLPMIEKIRVLDWHVWMCLKSREEKKPVDWHHMNGDLLDHFAEQYTLIYNWTDYEVFQQWSNNISESYQSPYLSAANNIITDIDSIARTCNSNFFTANDVYEHLSVIAAS